MSNLCKIARLPVFLLATAFSFGSAMAQNIDYAQEGMKCTQTTDRIQRLLCFDTVFKSPVPETAVPEVMENPAKPDGPLRTLANILEKQRGADDTGWVMRARPWAHTMLLTQEDYDKVLASPANKQTEDENSIIHQWTPQTVDIFMTMKEADVSAGQAHANEAVMMLSCENDITTLAVLLPEPITTLQANLSLSSSSNSLFNLHWRDVESGTVVIAGRGLESIDTIKTIANYARVQLQVNYPEGARAFVFDMNDLKDRLKPLRAACHW